MYMYRYEYDTNNHSTVSCGGICGSGQCACTHTHTHTVVAEAMSNEIHCGCLQPTVMVLLYIAARSACTCNRYTCMVCHAKQKSESC